MRTFDAAVTTLLEALGIVLIAAGCGAAAGLLIGWAGLAVSGVVVLIGAAVAEYRAPKTPTGGKPR